jgi:hypothetical protein
MQSTPATREVDLRAKLRTACTSSAVTVMLSSVKSLAFLVFVLVFSTKGVDQPRVKCREVALTASLALFLVLVLV